MEKDKFKNKIDLSGMPSVVRGLRLLDALSSEHEADKGKIKKFESDLVTAMKRVVELQDELSRIRKYYENRAESIWSVIRRDLSSYGIKSGDDIGLRYRHETGELFWGSNEEATDSFVEKISTLLAGIFFDIEKLKKKSDIG